MIYKQATCAPGIRLVKTELFRSRFAWVFEYLAQPHPDSDYHDEWTNKMTTIRTA